MEVCAYLIATCYAVQLITLGGVLLSEKGNGGGLDQQEKGSGRGLRRSEGERNKSCFFFLKKIVLFWIFI